MGPGGGGSVADNGDADGDDAVVPVDQCGGDAAFLTKNGQVFMDGAAVTAAASGGGDDSGPRRSPAGAAGRSASVTWKDESKLGGTSGGGGGGRGSSGEDGAASGAGGGSVLNARALELVSGVDSPSPGARGPMRRRVEEVGSWAEGDATDAAASAQLQQQQQVQLKQAAPPAAQQLLQPRQEGATLITTQQGLAAPPTVSTPIVAALVAPPAGAVVPTASPPPLNPKPYSPQRTPRGGGGGGGLDYEPTEIFSQHSRDAAALSDLCAVDDAAMCRVPAPEEALDPCTPAAVLPRLPVLEVGLLACGGGGGVGSMHPCSRSAPLASARGRSWWQGGV